MYIRKIFSPYEAYQRKVSLLSKPGSCEHYHHVFKGELTLGIHWYLSALSTAGKRRCSPYSPPHYILTLQASKFSTNNFLHRNTMPIVFSSPGASASPDQVPWIDEFVFLAETGQANKTLRTLGFKAYIARDSPSLKLSPLEYLKLFRNAQALFQDHIAKPNRPCIKEISKMDAPTMAPTLQFAAPASGPPRPVLTARRSSSMHKNVIAKLRPLPFQYIWTVWHDRATSASPDSDASYANRLQILASDISDIGAFYRVYNNFPWDSVKLKNTVHIFRAGVEPLWEDKENLDGGCWVIKVRREDGRATKVWEEVCLMGCGGELQAAISPGMSFLILLLFKVIVTPTDGGALCST